MDCRFVWIDLEMTGLDPQKAVIVEIASLVTDGDLNIIATGPEIAISHPDWVLDSMELWSLEHHKASGLMQRILESEVDTDGARQATLDFLRCHCEKEECFLAGNSVWQDRRFLLKYMPDLENFFHHRMIDVSTIKELAKQWYPDLEPYEKKNEHTAFSDIMESLNELRYYRKKVFIKGSSPKGLVGL